MKKLLSLLAIIVIGGGITPTSHAAQPIPDSFRGNWIDTTTNLWALSLWDGFAATDASFWDYEKWSGKGKTARATLRKADGTQRKFRFELLNDSTLVMTGSTGRHVLLRESPTTAKRPFTAPPDTASFHFGPWVNDSIRVEGFITGYKPGDAVYHYWSAALFGFELPNTPMPADSLGRFRTTIPATHDQLHTIGATVAAGPGNRLFIAYNGKGRNLFMGDNARVNQELDRHQPTRVVRQYIPNVNLKERVSDPMSWRFARIVARDMALAGLESYCREHRLSRKTQQLYNMLVKLDIIASICQLPYEHPELRYPSTYFMPGEGFEYSDPELLLWRGNGALINPFLYLWRTYDPLYVANIAGFRDEDRETFLEGLRINYTDPKRFKEFYDREGLRIISIFNSITPEIRMHWASAIADSMVPQRGLNRDIVFAEGLAAIWSFTEEPVSGKTIALIDSALSGNPFLRDTLRGLNERYRMLAERNAALEIPMRAIDSALTQPDSILRAILRPYAGKVVYLVFMEPEVPDEDKELEHLQTLREKLGDKEVEFVYISAALNPQRWRNAIAKYGLTQANDRHFPLRKMQMRALVQKYSINAIPAFLLFNQAGSRVTPILPPAEAEASVKQIEKLLAR